jgi:thiol-disulfide isomerase/thioredoxin
VTATTAVRSAGRTLALGDPAPEFEGLLGTDGRRHSLASFRPSGQLILVFVGNGCPSVKAYGEELNRIQQVYGPKGAQLVAVNANNEFLSPPDTYIEMVRVAVSRGWTFPYLKDIDRALAKACGATATPQVFVFDDQRRLRYRGRITDSRHPATATSHDLINAIEDLQAGREVAVPETHSIGCAIVW